VIAGSPTPITEVAPTSNQFHRSIRTNPVIIAVNTAEVRAARIIEIAEKSLVRNRIG